MRRISHDTFTSVIGIVYLALATNALLVLGCLPLVLLLITTDPVYSWPFLAVTAPLCAPSVTAAYRVFDAHGSGDAGVVRTFFRGWRATWRHSMTVAASAVAAVVVLLVDVSALSSSLIGVLLVPLLAVLVLVVVAVATVAGVAIAEAPRARLRDVLRASAYLALRRWYLTSVSLAVLAVFIAAFVGVPALALGVIATPALYLVFSNGRFTLLPVLTATAVPAA
jgi:uncharacterized membrane protein YesL